MKKLITLGMLFMMVATLSACSNNTDRIQPLTKEGVAPYKLSKRDDYLLRSLAMENKTQLVNFHAPFRNQIRICQCVSFIIK